jgi:hypothetical protein
MATPAEGGTVVHGVTLLNQITGSGVLKRRFYASDGSLPRAAV